MGVTVWCSGGRTFQRRPCSSFTPKTRLDSDQARLAQADVRRESPSEEPRRRGLGNHLVVGIDVPGTVDQTQLIPARRPLPYTLQRRIQLCQQSAVERVV